MDHGNIKKPAHGGTGKKNLGFLFLPAVVVIMALVLLLTPRPEGERREITLRTLELPAFPITLVLEENEGETAAAWLRTPAGARRIEQVEGLSFISSDPVVSRADQDDSDDLLWRISFMNVKGEGIHLWIGMTTWAPRVYVAATPFQYTRWHALPAKIEVPKGTSLYISPAAPLYRTLEKQFGGTDSYSFVYTMMLAELRPRAVGLQTARRPAARGDARRKLAAEAPRLRPYADGVQPPRRRQSAAGRHPAQFTDRAHRHAELEEITQREKYTEHTKKGPRGPFSHIFAPVPRA